MSSVQCGPNSEVTKAIENVTSYGVDSTAASKALAYLETELEPGKNQITTSLLEAIATQLVFFYIILLVLLVICVVWCCWAVGISPKMTLGILAVMVLLSVIVLVVVVLTLINSVKVAADNLVNGITRANVSAEETKILAVIESAAQLYLTAIL